MPSIQVNNTTQSHKHEIRFWFLNNTLY
jgi:hypothetical protein